MFFFPIMFFPAFYVCSKKSKQISWFFTCLISRSHLFPPRQATFWKLHSVEREIFSWCRIAQKLLSLLPRSSFLSFFLYFTLDLRLRYEMSQSIFLLSLSHLIFIPTFVEKTKRRKVKLRIEKPCKSMWNIFDFCFALSLIEFSNLVSISRIHLFTKRVKW